MSSFQRVVCTDFNGVRTLRCVPIREVSSFIGWCTLMYSNVGMEMRVGKLTGPSKPMPLILDDEGRVVDTSGRTIQPMMRQPTIKVSTI